MTVSEQMLIFFINVMPFRFSVTLKGSNGSDKDIMSACVFVALVSQQDYWAQVATISTCFSRFTKRFIFLNTVSPGFSQGPTKVKLDKSTGNQTLQQEAFSYNSQKCSPGEMERWFGFETNPVLCSKCVLLNFFDPLILLWKAETIKLDLLGYYID